MWLILSSSFVISIIVAALMYYVIEKPSMLLGRNITSKFKRIDSISVKKTA